MIKINKNTLFREIKYDKMGCKQIITLTAWLSFAEIYIILILIYLYKIARGYGERSSRNRTKSMKHSYKNIKLLYYYT